MTTETTCLSSIWKTDEDTRDYLKLHGREEAYKELYSDAENVLHFEPIPAEVQLYGELNAVRKQLVQSLPNHNLIGQLMKLRL